MIRTKIAGLEFGSKPILTVTVLDEDIDRILSFSKKAMESGADCVEIRVDKIKTNQEVKELIQKADFPYILSSRSKMVNGFFEGSEKERVERQIVAIEAGATIIDIELTTDSQLRDEVIRTAKNYHTPLLIGFEDMQKMPAIGKILSSLKEIEDLGADIAKFAVRTSCYEEALDVLKVANWAKDLIDIPFAAIALGESGLFSRPLALLMGSSMTYCAIESGGPLKQLSIKQVRNVLENLS
ncbi:MAG: type I 3-dehydroquinate dehydratase [Candidatus Atribacteria bacterium]|nr:type I 3-dehydroquinate dehydratase [Candidatus Atribacteria bacterium]